MECDKLPASADPDVKKEVAEYDEKVNRFSLVWYIVGFKLAVYAAMYFLRPLLWTMEKEL